MYEEKLLQLKELYILSNTQKSFFFLFEEAGVQEPIIDYYYNYEKEKIFLRITQYGRRRS